MDIKDKKILVIGAGISGNAAAKLTKELGAAEVILSDYSENMSVLYIVFDLISILCLFDG